MKIFMKAGLLTLGIATYMSCSAARPDELASLKTENQSLKDQLQTKDSQIDALNEKLSALSAEQTPKSTNNADYDSVIKGLKDEIAADKVKLSQTENALSITFLDSVFFAEGSADISSDGMKSLDKIITPLKNLHDKFIRVEGYADDLPINENYRWKYPSNWELSTARASAIVRYLQSKGIDPGIMKAAGYGKFNPVTSNSTEEGRAKNRRIVVELIPLDIRAKYK
jgi:chemotaxis protein MotB